MPELCRFQHKNYYYIVMKFRILRLTIKVVKQVKFWSIQKMYVS